MLTNTLRHAAVGINVASTISLELCLFDKPVINIGYNPPGVDLRSHGLPIDFLDYYEYEHYRPIAQSGAVHVVRTEQELGPAIRMALAAPGARRDPRRQLVNRFFEGRSDGRCASRVAQCLAKLALPGGAQA